MVGIWLSGEMKAPSRMPDTPLSHYLRTNNVATCAIEDVSDPYVKAGAAYWRSLCGQRKFPARGELTLRGMAAFLPHVIIIRVDDNGADYEYCYVGEAQRQAYGMPLKGIRLTQIEAATPQLGALVRSVFEQVRSSQVPLVVRGRIYSELANDKRRFHETIWMPLGDSETCVDHLLMIGVQVPKPFWEATPDKLRILADHGRAPA